MLVCSQWAPRKRASSHCGCVWHSLAHGFILQLGGGFGLGGGGSVVSFTRRTFILFVTLVPSSSVTRTSIGCSTLVPGFIFGSVWNTTFVRAFPRLENSTCAGSPNHEGVTCPKKSAAYSGTGSTRYSAEASVSWRLTFNEAGPKSPTAGTRGCTSGFPINSTAPAVTSG